jgi:hypothetical protein
VPVAEPGRVVEFESGLRWRVLFPELEHEAASGYLRELAASDCSTATLRSYAFDLLRWFRFLHRQYTPWERAERLDVRSFVEWLQQAPNPQRIPRLEELVGKVRRESPATPAVLELLGIGA